MTELAQMFELQQSATFFGSWGGSLRHRLRKGHRHGR